MQWPNNGDNMTQNKTRDDKKWWGRIGYDREGIVREVEFETEVEAKAYALGASDMKEQSDITDEGVLEDYWTTHSDEESFDEQ